MPDLAEQLRTGGTNTAPQHEELHQGELLGGEIDGDALIVHGALHAVHLNAAEAQNGIGEVFAAAQESAAAGHQFMKAEGLEDEVVGSEVEAANALLDLTAAGKHQDSGAGEVSAHGLEHLGAIAARQAEIQHHEIGGLLRGHLERGVTISNPFHLVALQHESFAEKHPQRLIIFNNQNTHSRPSVNK